MGQRTNFLMIVADQLRPDSLGIAGRRRAFTPNIDALALRGTTFENAFTPLPVCAPARQAMICGKNPDSYGAFWNYSFFNAASLSPGGYWPEQLAASGYSCAFLGKWGASEKYGPDGFGYSDCVDYAEYESMVNIKYPNRERFSWFGGTSELSVVDSRTHWLSLNAANKIKSYSKLDTPWHIRVDFTDPHLPCEVCEPFASMHDPALIDLWEGCGDTLEGKPYIQRQQRLTWGIENMTEADWRVPIARYLGMVSQLDAGVGILHDALVESGTFDNTIVLFTSDHGDMCGSRGMIDKHYVLYDDVVKVPLIFAGPKIKKGARRNELVSSGLDLPPTIDELFGLCSTRASGYSFAALLRNDPGYNARKYINASSNGQQFGFFNQRMLRGQRYKYIWNLTDIDEFYDLQADPGEKNNLIYNQDHADIISEMRKALLSTLKEQGDMYLRGGWLDRQLSENKKI